MLLCVAVSMLCIASVVATGCGPDEYLSTTGRCIHCVNCDPNDRDYYAYPPVGGSCPSNCNCMSDDDCPANSYCAEYSSYYTTGTKMICDTCTSCSANMECNSRCTCTSHESCNNETTEYCASEPEYRCRHCTYTGCIDELSVDRECRLGQCGAECWSHSDCDGADWCTKGHLCKECSEQCYTKSYYSMYSLPIDMRCPLSCCGWVYQSDNSFTIAPCDSIGVTAEILFRPWTGNSTALTVEEATAAGATRCSVSYDDSSGDRRFVLGHCGEFSVDCEDRRWAVTIALKYPNGTVVYLARDESYTEFNKSDSCGLRALNAVVVFLVIFLVVGAICAVGCCIGLGVACYACCRSTQRQPQPQPQFVGMQEMRPIAAFPVTGGQVPVVGVVAAYPARGEEVRPSYYQYSHCDTRSQ